MKSFNEYKNPPTKNIVKESETVPSFMEFIGESGEGQSSQKLQAAMATFHSIQLDIQECQKKILAARDSYLSHPQGSKDRLPYENELNALNKEKILLDKKLKDSQRVLDKSLAEEDEDLDIDINLI